MSNAASASPDSNPDNKEAVGGVTAGGGQQNEVASVPHLVVVTSDAGDDNAVPKPMRIDPTEALDLIGPRPPGGGNNGTAVLGCTDDDAKEMETDAGVEVVAADAADNKTVDAAPNAEEG
jgi:hypothetical protein